MEGGGFTWRLDATKRSLQVAQKRKADRHHNRFGSVGAIMVVDPEYSDVVAATAAGIAAAAKDFGIELDHLALGDGSAFVTGYSVSMAYFSPMQQSPLDWIKHLDLTLTYDTSETLSRVACRRMQQLETLQVFNSTWQYLPMEIGLLVRLRSLRVWTTGTPRHGSGRIRVWPPTMGRLRKLGFLDISPPVLFAKRKAALQLPVAERTHAVFHATFAPAPQAAAYALLAILRRRRRVPKELARTAPKRLLDTANLPCWFRVTKHY